MLAVLLVAASVGLDNFAASIAIGVSGVDTRTRLRAGAIFGAFETGMPLLGLLLGSSLASALGNDAQWIGAALLTATGIYAIVQSPLRPECSSDRSALAGGCSTHPGIIGHP